MNNHGNHETENGDFVKATTIYTSLMYYLQFWLASTCGED